MASVSVGRAAGADAGALLIAAAAGQGSAAHRWPTDQVLVKGPDSSRNLADMLHFLCTLHGRYPGIVDRAARRAAGGTARSWLAQAAYSFAGERAYLARLAVAAGPVPSTPGASASDAAVLGQRNAIETLAQSEREGCALGAAMALVLDWIGVRHALDAAADRFGIEPPAYWAGDPAAIADAANAFVATPALQRALLFGAEQVLIQHFGLWDLLESRAAGRAG
jgi:hypothetical protein